MAIFTRNTLLVLVSLALSSHLTISANNVTLQTKLEGFWQSVANMASHDENRLRGIGDQIAKIGFELNQTSSDCYQIIRLALKNAYAHKWSAKCKLSNYLFFNNLTNSIFFQ